MEAALEQKSHEHWGKEQALNEKVYRLEKQLKSRNYFDAEKKRIAELEKENQELKDALSQQKLIRQTDAVEQNRKA